MKTLIALLAGACTLLIAAAQSEKSPDSESGAKTGPFISSGTLSAQIEGPVLFRSWCAACHGLDGRGNGPIAPSLKTAPPDLTRIAARNNGIFPVRRVERIISGEEQIPAAHGTREMPLWGNVFSQIAWDQDLGRLRVHNLAEYLARIQEPRLQDR